MVGPATDSIAPHVPAHAAGPIDQQRAMLPAGSKLAGHARATAPSQPRVPSQPQPGLLRRIGRTIANAVSRLFSTGQSGVARISSSRKRQLDFQQSLGKVKEALLSPGATPDTIRNSLLLAAAAARKLRAQDGPAGELIQRTFEQLFESASAAELSQIAIVLRSEELATLQPATSRESGWDRVLVRPAPDLRHNDHALQVLTGLEVALQARIDLQVERTVGKQIDAAVSVMHSSGPDSRVTDHLRLAFSAAVPLVKPGTLVRGDDTDTGVRRTILGELEKLPEATCRELLIRFSPEDLGNLYDAATTYQLQIKEGLEHEIKERPARLAAELPRRSQHFVKRCEDGKEFDRGAFVRGLSGISRELASVEAHLGWAASLAVPKPADPQDLPKRADIHNPPELADIKHSVAQAAQDAISSGKLDLTDLMAVEIRELTAAFSALGVAEAGNVLLEGAQLDMLRQCSQNLERSLAKLGKALISGNDPEDLLKRLTEAANAATALEHTQSTLGPRAGRLDPNANQRALIENWFARLPEMDPQALATALSGPHFQPLIDDLSKAEKAARDAREMTTAGQFHAMGDTLELIQTRIESESGASASSEAAPAAPSEPLRQALRKLYGVEISGPRITLNAGQLNAEHTEIVARNLHQPLSPRELAPAQVGNHVITEPFLLDARRRMPHIWVADTPDASAPLIDHRSWPESDEERDLRIAAGYERLIEFCGGDETQARTLAAYLTQQVTAGLLEACTREDGPLHLDDGRVVGIGDGSSGEGKVDIDVTLHRGENGRPQLDVSCHWKGRNSVVPVAGGLPVYLSADSSLEMSYRAELNDGTLTLLGAPSYRFSLKADNFQKRYSPPTAHSLRRAEETSAALKDTLNYCEPLGKDYQVTALRAVDAFAREPTVHNAVAVIAECDRGAAEAAELISPEVRAAVALAAENSKQGIHAALAGARSTALQITQYPSEFAGIPPITLVNARGFVRQMEALEKESGANLLKEAERLYYEFVEQPAAGAKPAEDRRTLPIDPTAAEEMGRQLAAQRQAAAQFEFAPDLFGDLADTLAKRLDTEVLPGMVDAVEQGQI